MLPDFPKTKQLIDKLLMERIQQARKQHMGQFAEIPIIILHEGNETSLERHDGTVDNTPIEKHQVSSELSHKGVELKDLKLATILEHYDELGKKLGEQQMSLFVRRMEESVQETGNIIESSGTVEERIYAMIEKAEIPFDSFGRPIAYSFLVKTPETQKIMEDAFNEIWNHHEKRRRFDNLLAKKREEWRDRENTRKLVD